MKIHHGKVFNRKDSAQQRWIVSRKTSREDSPELNNREINATIKKRKKKIKCPKACDMKKYEKFDKEISEILRTNKGNIVQKHAKLTERIYSVDERRFRHENHNQQKAKNREKNSFQKQEKINSVQKEKNQKWSR